MSLNQFDFFSHGKASKVLYCKPDDAAAGLLKKLQAKLEHAFPQCDDLSRKSGLGFQPHLTLGQYQSGVRDLSPQFCELPKLTAAAGGRQRGDHGRA